MSRDPQVRQGRLHSPFFVWFRRLPVVADGKILARFRLRGYRRVEEVQDHSTYVVLADVGEWTMIADDWRYKLWHMPSTVEAIEKLARERDVFTWSIGECDLSFAFRLFRDGGLIREHVVDSPHFNDQVVRTSFGAPLPFEGVILASGKDLEAQLFELAAVLGVETSVTRESLRIYSKPDEASLNLTGSY